MISKSNISNSHIVCNIQYNHYQIQQSNDVTYVTTYVKLRYDEELSTTVFDPRFLCNVESAIRYHPNNTLCILIHLPPQSPAIKSLSNSVYQLYEKIKKAKVWIIVIWYNVFWSNFLTGHKPYLVRYHTIFYE